MGEAIARKIDEDFLTEDYDNPLKSSSFIHGDKTDINPIPEKSEKKYWISDYALNRIAKNQNYMLLITGGTGCQPKGSQVLMADGSWKNIEDIKLNDVILSPQKNGGCIRSKVLKLYEWQSDMCFQIVDYKNEVLYECSDNHEIPHIDNSNNKIIHKTAKELWGMHIRTFKKDMSKIYVKVIPKNPKGSEIVYGFTLDSPSSWYVTDNWMITKNSGKSYSAMEIALDIDPTFTQKRIVFTALEFMDLLMVDKPPPRSVIVWDEVGVELSSRTWFSAQNKMMSFVFETFRRDNLILIMTTPNVSFIDKKIRSMLHGYMEILDPSQTNNVFGRAKYFHIMLNLMEGKTYYQYPRTIDDWGRQRILRGRSRTSGNMNFHLPPTELTEPYEIRKKALVERVKQETSDVLKGIKAKTKLLIPDIVEELEGNPRLYKLNISEEEMTKGQLVAHINVLLSINFPELKMSKGDIKDAIEFILLSKGGDGKTKTQIRDEEMDMIKRLFKLYHGNKTRIAKAINVSDVALGKKIKKWKKEELWDEVEIMNTEYI